MASVDTLCTSASLHLRNDSRRVRVKCALSTLCAQEEHARDNSCSQTRTALLGIHAHEFPRVSLWRSINNVSFGMYLCLSAMMPKFSRWEFSHVIPGGQQKLFGRHHGDRQLINEGAYGRGPRAQRLTPVISQNAW